MPRIAWILAGVTIAALTVTASAASLSVFGAGLASGTASISACDTDGVEFSYALDTAGNVTSVTVGDVDVACQGGTLRMTLANGGAAIGSGSVLLPSSGPWIGSYEVAISPTPASGDVTATHAAIEGP